MSESGFVFSVSPLKTPGIHIKASSRLTSNPCEFVHGKFASMSSLF